MECVYCKVCMKQFHNKQNKIPRSHRHVEKCLKILNDLYDIKFDYEYKRIPFNEIHYNEIVKKYEELMEFRNSNIFK